MRWIGKLLQLLGLVVLPLGMLLQLGETISLGKMLVMMVAGASAFWLGRLIEGYAVS